MRNLSYLSIIVTLLLIKVTEIGAQPHEPADIAIEYSLLYSWDRTINEWSNPGKQEYYFNEFGRTDSVISINLLSGDQTNRTVYYYDSYGNLIEYSSEKRDNDAWLFVRKYLITRDNSGRVIEQLVYDYLDGVWVSNRRQFNYEYDGTKNLGFDYQRKVEDGWETYRDEKYSYNSEDQVVYSISQNTSGEKVNQVYYYYNEFGQRESMLVQGWSDYHQNWVDGYRDKYDYNNCGKRISKLRQRYVKDEWINESKSENYYGVQLLGIRNAKVPVCHNGKTIYVSYNAVEAHLRHGDCLGECNEERNHGKRGRIDDKNGSDVATIYPNPARDRVTIELGKNECNISRIQISDFYGRVVRNIQVRNQNEIIVPRQGLISGKYSVTMFGDNVYNSFIIFK